MRIVNKLGLQVRAAVKFVGSPSPSTAVSNVKKAGRRVNGKSIMGVMIFAASQGPVLEGPLT